MTATQQGLTKTYNALKDPACDDPAIVELRALHLDLDRAVLAAYGWSDLAPLVPPYTTPQTPAERRIVEIFEDAVLDRLFALNATRAAAEARQPPPTKPPAGAPKATKGKRSSPAPSAQGSLLPEDDA